MFKIVFKMQVANLYFDYYVAFIDKMSAPKMSYKKLHSVKYYNMCSKNFIKYLGI